MLKRLYWLAVLVLLVAAFSIPPATAAQIPMCYSDLPHYSYPDPSWTYSHQCYEGTRIWYVYVDFRGKWKLCSSTILP